MPTRTTDQKVIDRLETVEPGANMSRHILMASSLVTELATKYPSAHDTERLEHIETCLAAHFYTRRNVQYASKSTDGGSGSFQGQTGMSLDSTFHGQDAKMMDTTGWLAKLDKGKKTISFGWIGNPANVHEQVDYQQSSE